jgi:hypothetical protein
MHTAKEPSMKSTNKSRALPRLASVALASLALAAMVLSASCNQDPEGIFSSLEKEEPVATQSTKALSSASPARVVKVGDAYYMAAKAVYTRSLARAKDAWTAVPYPAGGDANWSCIDLSAIGARLYAAFVKVDAAGALAPAGLFSFDPAASAWTAIDPAFFAAAGSEISALIPLNGILFVSYKESIGTPAAVNYRLARLDSATDTGFDAGISVPFDGTAPWNALPIVSGAYDGSQYWFVSGPTIYRGTLGAFAALSGETGMPANVTLKSVAYRASASPRLVFATGSGMYKLTAGSETLTGSTPGLIYARLSDGSWEQSAAIILSTGTTDGRANFTDLAVIGSPDGTVGDDALILAGSQASIKFGDGKLPENKANSARGYATLKPPATGSLSGLDKAASPEPLSIWANFQTSLQSHAVIRFSLLPGAEAGARVLFACSSGAGLWSNSQSPDGAWEGWRKE